MADHPDSSTEREPLAHPDALLPHDPEEASRALAEVRALLERHRLVFEVAHRQRHGEADERHQLVEQLVHKQALNQLGKKLDRMHRADIAFLLEGLRLDDRLMVRDVVKAERAGDLLLDVSDPVRGTRTHSMQRH